MRRTRRRRLVTWLPNLEQAGNADEKLNIINSSIIIDSRGVTTAVCVPLVRDLDETTGQSLADYTQGGYLLQRIVGKIFLGVVPTPGGEGTTAPGAGLFNASFEILRVDEDGNPLKAGADADYNPFKALNERDPFIWSRSWILGNSATTNIATDDWSDTFKLAPPQNFYGYGSAVDGPHIDAKVKRRVGPEERLFFICTSWSPTEIAGGTDVQVQYCLQYRVLGSPLRSSNRRNASR